MFQFFYVIVLIQHDYNMKILYVVKCCFGQSLKIDLKVTFARNLAKKIKFIFVLIQSFISVISSKS